jgi:hypothetical protein
MNHRTSVRAHEAQKGESHMKQTAMLTTVSLLNILLMTLHLTSDIQFKMAPGGLPILYAVFFFVVLLCGTLLLAGRRSGYIIIFFGSVFGVFMPILHMRGARGMIGGEIANSGQAFFFVFILLTLSVTASFSTILSARALWSLPWRRSRRASTAA